MASRANKVATPEADKVSECHGTGTGGARGAPPRVQQIKQTPLISSVWWEELFNPSDIIWILLWYKDAVLLLLLFQTEDDSICSEALRGFRRNDCFIF
ncbi:hypothetical protein FQA47_025628 [Oryzias melastigma]|uniref:Uncharacterized protein n=1 Tax=Oryzias melastigma TaxID=30732 RepID=A0A834CHH3_ORYME|nr:hypothetical protein FQA47_025628 [Oryzias melastigma]